MLTKVRARILGTRRVSSSPAADSPLERVFHTRHVARDPRSNCEVVRRVLDLAVGQQAPAPRLLLAREPFDDPLEHRLYGLRRCPGLQLRNGAFFGFPVSVEDGQEERGLSLKVS